MITPSHPLSVSRRQFLRFAGGCGLAAGMQPWLGPFAEAGSVAEGEISPAVGLIGAFNTRAFQDPEAVLWPGYFWLWNGTLEPDRLRAQLRDMAEHDARSVCVLPMPHGFRPDSTNNELSPDYLTPEYFQRVGDSVDEAARLGMAWWLYDEGGWPSGQALGKVVDGHPELTRRMLTRKRIPTDQPFLVPADALCLVVQGADTTVLRPGDRWTAASPADSAFLYEIVSAGGVDLLNPAATDRFLALTHEQYGAALGRHLGKTVKFTFTDEPSAGMPQPPNRIPWFPGLPEAYETLCGRRFLPDLPHLFHDPDAGIPPAAARARVALYDVITRRYAAAYFERLRTWTRRRFLASGGHLGGEDEVFGAIKYGFGHLLRQLRAMDVPGVDLIWRQLFPGRDDQSNFPLAAASVAHQNGTRFVLSESFCVYGNGLTPSQMKWLTDYQYIRGVNLLVLGCYPLSTRNHHMTGERPHFGPMNPLWDHLPGYHGYVARLGYATSIGQPRITTALYYPVRDMWARGFAAKDAVETFEYAAHELMARQCPPDFVDDDALALARVRGRELVVGAMRYRTIVCGRVQWMAPASRRVLEDFAAAGGDVRCVDVPPCCDGADGGFGGGGGGLFKIGPLADVLQGVTPLVALSPVSRSIRVLVREHRDQRVAVLFNEGTSDYQGCIEPLLPHVTELDLMNGGMIRRIIRDRRVPVSLAPGETRAFLFTRTSSRSAGPGLEAGEMFEVDPENIHAVGGRQISAGEHDYEISPRVFDNVPFRQSAVWKSWLGEDFSGEVDYKFEICIPPQWGTTPVQLETGPLEYAATVFLDGRKMGHLLWAPWRLTLPECHPGKHTVVVRVANTLANELVSDRVSREWAGRKGPGWPSPYHERALKFERESRGGGMSGRVRVVRLVHARGLR